MKILLILLLLVSNSIYSQIVHVTKTGSRYHTSDCRYLWNSDYILSLREALDRYYTPCQVCEPPTKIRKKKKKLPIVINHSNDNQRGGLTRYYLNGVQVTEEEYEKKTTKRTPIEKTDSIFGIGINLSEYNGKVFVQKVIPGSPAWIYNTLQVGDTLTWLYNTIDNTKSINLRGLSSEMVVKLLRSPKDKTVTLGFLRKGMPNRITINKSIISEKMVEKSFDISYNIGFENCKSLVDSLKKELRYKDSLILKMDH